MRFWTIPAVAGIVVAVYLYSMVRTKRQLAFIEDYDWCRLWQHHAGHRRTWR